MIMTSDLPRSLPDHFLPQFWPSEDVLDQFHSPKPTKVGVNVGLLEEG